MRGLLAIACTGCSSLLGISDPTPANGDGGMDAVDSHIDAPPPCTTSISLKPEVTSELGKNGRGFVIGRFNNGLDEDIAVATGVDVTVLFGDRTGAFGGTPQVVPTAAGEIVIGDWDLNQSADDDIAMYTVGGNSVVARRQNRNNTPPFESEQPLLGPFTNVRNVIAGEFGGNGNTDLLVHDDGGSRVYTASGATAGAFLRAATTIAPAADELVLVQQIDGASFQDALFVNGSEVKLALQTGSGFGTPGIVTNMAATKHLALGRFDADNLVDLVVSTNDGLVLFRQNPATPGTFNLHGAISPLKANKPIAVGDVNDDGRDDIVLANAAILQCAPVNGIGVFTQVEAIDADGAKFVDVSGDGKADLVRLQGTTIKVRLR